MREIDSKLITNSIYKCCVDAAYFINDDVLNKIIEAKDKESDSIAKNILCQIIDNDKLAKDEYIPMCQDTGVVLVFVEIGRDVHVSSSIDDAINEGVRKAYNEAFLRKSVVRNPIDRINTNDNDKAIALGIDKTLRARGIFTSGSFLVNICALTNPSRILH